MNNYLYVIIDIKFIKNKSIFITLEYDHIAIQMSEVHP